MGCGLIQNWEDIQLFFSFIILRSCCGLIQNWEDIQLDSQKCVRRNSCGLIQNWEDIQHLRSGQRQHYVVVWYKIEKTFNRTRKGTGEGMLWFDTKLRRHSTIASITKENLQLWFDTKLRRHSTIDHSVFLSSCCGLIQNWEDIQLTPRAYHLFISCGLIQNWEDIQLRCWNYHRLCRCGLIQNWEDIQHC